jgi:hypothetical protein
MRTYFFNLKFQHGVTVTPAKNRAHKRKLARFCKHAVKTAGPSLTVEYMFFCSAIPDQSQVNQAVSEAVDLILSGKAVYFEDGS